MKDEWKRFLLQWILPVGVFGVILAILFASFNANIKQETVAEYEGDLVVASSEYATSFTASINRLQAVAESVLEVERTKDSNGNGTDFKEALGPMTKYSDAYMAILIDEDGQAYTDSGATFAATQLPYYENIATLQNKGLMFVTDDGINASSALAVKVNLDEDQNGCVMLYYPLTVTALRKLVPVQTDVDNTAFCIITDKDGKILATSGKQEKYPVLENFWDEIAPKNDSNTIKKVKTRVQSFMSGSFDVNYGGVANVVTYTPINDTNLILMVNYQKDNISAAEEKIFYDNTSRLKWFVLIVVIFILVITAINIAQIYVSSKNTDELKDKADTDQLTGLKNKLATEREIKEYIENHPDTIGMMFIIDIDNFKKINDTMGHAFGDEVLRELGRNIGINFRVSDIIGRTGGDEFTIFLKNLKEDANTLREAQKLIYFFRHFQVGDYVKYSVTASIGAAVFPAHGADFETLYKAADSAVYKSKKRGKNQLSFYDDRDRTPEEVAEADSHLIDIERKEETPIESDNR